jgi:DedD protein
MSRDDKTSADYAAILEPGRVRRARLVRAGLASLLIVVLGLGLLAIDEDGDEPDAQPRRSSVAMVGAEAAAALAPAPPIAGDTNAAVAQASEPVVPATAPALTATDPAGHEAESAPQAAPVPAPAIAPAPLGVASAERPPPGRGFMVQLGVFGAPENADRLRDELAAQGFSAHVQSRVVVGPFADRKSADLARARLHDERKLDGLIVPPRKP